MHEQPGQKAEVKKTLLRMLQGVAGGMVVAASTFTLLDGVTPGGGSGQPGIEERVRQLREDNRLQTSADEGLGEGDLLAWVNGGWRNASWRRGGWVNGGWRNI
jgi:hypothetical protein